MAVEQLSGGGYALSCGLRHTVQEVLPSFPLSLSLPLWSSPSGVADQLQTNYASDLRSILKTLFEVMATKPETDDKEKLKKGECHLGQALQLLLTTLSTPRGGSTRTAVPAALRQ